MTLLDKSLQLTDVQKAFDAGNQSSKAAFQASVSQVSSVNSKAGAVTLAKADVGLGYVDNTSDANKPVSTAQATAIGAKMDATLPALQTVFDGGTAAQKSAFQASVSGYNASLYPVGSIMSDIAAQAVYSPDFVFAVASDSTGNEDDEKIRRLANYIAGAFPDAYVDYRLMNTGTDLYGAPVKLSTGGTEPSVTVGADLRGWACPVSVDVADLDVRVDCTLANWASGANQVIAAHYGNAGFRSWYLRVSSTGTLVISWLEADGVTVKNYYSSALGFAAGSRNYIRVTVDVDNGASGHSVAFYKSADGQTWTQIGTTQTTAGVSSFFKPTNQVHEIGSRGAGNGSTATAGTVEGAVGTFYYAHFSPEIGGYNRYYENIRDWRSEYSMTGTRSAGMAIRFYNGAYPGQNFAYFTTGVRAERMFPRISDNAVVIINTSHNEGSQFQDGVYETGAAAMKARIDARIARYRGVVSTQNPKLPPATVEQIYAQMRRCTRSIPAIAAQYGWLVSDEFRLSVWSVPGAINADGIHPASGSGLGREAQGNCLIRACGGAV